MTEGFHRAAVHITQSILHCIFVDEQSDNTDVRLVKVSDDRQRYARLVKHNVQCLKGRAWLGRNQGKSDDDYFNSVTFSDYTHTGGYERQLIWNRS